MLRLISEHGAVDALLSAVVDELAPYEQGISCFSPQHDFLSGSGKQDRLSSIGIDVSAIVPSIQREAVKIAVPSQPPQGNHGRPLALGGQREPWR